MLAVAAALLFAGAAEAAEPWIGRWIIDPKFCKEVGDTTETMPLILRAKSLKWYTTRCSYHSGATRRGESWHIDARCSGEGKRSRIPIVLQVKGDRMVMRWGDAKPDEMRRCP
jgi:hypothetical protein